MASNTGVQDPTAVSGAAQAAKGKGKAVEDDAMHDAHAEVDDDDDDDSDDDDEGAADNDDDDADDGDDLQEIDLENVVGRRTRGVVIDYAKAAAENPVDEEDDDDDDDFEDPDTKMDED